MVDHSEGRFTLATLMSVLCIAAMQLAILGPMIRPWVGRDQWGAVLVLWLYGGAVYAGVVGFIDSFDRFGWRPSPATWRSVIASGVLLLVPQIAGMASHRLSSLAVLIIGAVVWPLLTLLTFHRLLKQSRTTTLIFVTPVTLASFLLAMAGIVMQQV